MKRKSFRLFFRSLLTKFGSVQTDKGLLTYDGDAELAVGDEVYIEDNTNPDDSQYNPAPDGEYTADGDVKIVVKDGNVESIDKNDDKEEKDAIEKSVVEVNAADETVADETVIDPIPVEEPGFNAEEAIKLLTKAVAELSGRVDALQSNVNALLSVPQEENIFSKYSRSEKKNYKKNLFKCTNY